MDLVSWTFGNEDYDQDKPIYLDPSDPSRCLTARDCRTLVRKLVAGLQSNGLEKGDCVCVISFNDIHYSSLYLGIIGSGGRFTGANPGYTAHELAHHVRMTKAKFFISQVSTLETAQTAADECGIARENIYVFNPRGEEIPAGYKCWTELLESGERDWVAVDDTRNTPAGYVSTSGTSGLPKAAILCHSYMVSQGEFLTREMKKMETKPSYLVALPPFHVFTVPVQHAVPLRQGSQTYIMPRFEADGFANACEKYQIDRTIAVPPILTSLAKSDVATPKRLRSLRKIYVGGSCAGKIIQDQLYAKLHEKAHIEQVYGMTEIGWATTTWRDKKRDDTGSVGSPVPGYRVRLVSRSGQIVHRDGVTGEIHVYGEHLMKGYLDQPLATAEAFSHDGWIRTGDIGYRKDGRWYVVDRTKDLIKVRGWQVSPAEIEASLIEHPDIIDAGVIGIPSQDGLGEVPQAFVVKNPQSVLTEKDIKTFLGARLARYKQVDHVEFVDRVPRNPTGKILRRVLREAKANPVPTSDQVNALAYSKAIIDLEKTHQKRKSDMASSCDSCSHKHYHTDSTTSTSTTATTVSNKSTESEKGRKRRKIQEKAAALTMKLRRRSPRQVMMVKA